jgi:o-succinylbenzoate synthase
MEAVRIARAEVRHRAGYVAGDGVVTSRRRWHERQGLLLELTDEDGRRGLGEASPLPGVSPDTLSDCAKVLAELPVPWALGVGDGSLVEAVEVAVSAVDPACPAARFALESALLDLAGQVVREPVWRLLGGRSPGAVGVNALLPSGREAAVAAATAAVARGVTTLKMKVGAAERLIDELEVLAAVREAVGDGVWLRLDANRAWAPEAARARLAELARFQPELIEEPVIHARLDELGEPSPVPVALDESLAEGGSYERAAELLAAGWVSALVLKPAVLGGALRCLDWAQLARGYGAEVVVTHCLDGPVGMAGAMELALALGPKLACGLDHHPLRSAWPEVDPPRLQGAKVVATDAVGLGFPVGAFRSER